MRDLQGRSGFDGQEGRDIRNMKVDFRSCYSRSDSDKSEADI